MTVSFLKYGLLCLVILSSCNDVCAKDRQQGSNKQELLNNLKSSDWRLRDEAVVKLSSQWKKDKDPKIAVALLNLLNREITRSEKVTGGRGDVVDPIVEQAGEAFGEYRIDLVDIVGHTNNRAAIPALVASVDYGPRVWDFLSEFDDESVDPIIHEFTTSKNEHRRGSCISALGRLLEVKLSAHSVQKIHSVLRAALSDRNEYVRENARNILEEKGISK